MRSQLRRCIATGFVFATVTVFALQADAGSVAMKCTIVANKSQKNGQRVLYFIVDDQKKTFQDMSSDCQVREVSPGEISGWCPSEKSANLFVRINRISGEIEATYHNWDLDHNVALAPPFENDKPYRGTCQQVKKAIP